MLVKRLLHLYWQFSRGLTIGVRAVVVDPRGRIFLIRHVHTKGWHLPGGGVEAGETFAEAMTRELKEEGNIEPAAPPRLHGVSFYPLYSRRDHVMIYEVRAFRQPSLPQPNNEIAECGFFSPDALPAGTTRGTRARIAEVLEGRPLAERW